MSQPIQTRANHVRFDPFFHFFLVPGTLALFIWSLVHLYHFQTSESAFLSALSLFLFLLVFLCRIYSLKVQDRVIRLEERLRLSALASDALRPRISDLRVGQLVALRFASDAEVASLAEQSLDQNLGSKQIKAAIQNWRGDYFRV